MLFCFVENIQNVLSSLDFFTFMFVEYEWKYLNTVENSELS